MTTAPPRQPPAPQPADAQQLTVGQIVAILAAGLAAKKTLELLTRTLSPLGITAAAVKVAFLVGGRRQHTRRADASRYRAPHGTHPLRRPGRSATNLTGPSALHATLAGEDVFRAAYVYSAAERVQRALDDARRTGVSQQVALARAELTEQRHYQQHRLAQARRRQAAAQVDVTASRHGVPFIDPATGESTLLVGWYATLDRRTSAECRRADGANFPANRPPRIGWPGAVHPHCRCKPGRPHTGGRLV